MTGEGMTGDGMTEDGKTPTDAPPENDPRPDGLKPAKSLLLVNTGDNLALVDTGCGEAFGSTTGKLRTHLARVGADPGDIDTVVLTHLHPDHAAGLITDAGIGWLPKATFLMHEAEERFWSAPSPDLSKSGVPQEMHPVMSKVAKQLWPTSEPAAWN